MVEGVVQGGVGGFDVGEIHHPAAGLADGAADVDLDAEGVAVQAGTLVVGWDVRQAMGRVESEYGKDLHGLILPYGP